MPLNPNPFTPFQIKLLDSIRAKLIEIRDPDKEVLDDRHFEFYLENTKKFGPIPKIRFKPNAQKVKHEIMIAAGYTPTIKKSSHKALISAAASAFDKHWDGMMAALTKSAKRIAVFNQTFAEDGQVIAEVIRLIQASITPNAPKDRIHNQKKEEKESYIDKLNQTK